MTREQVIAEMSEELDHSRYAVEVSVDAFRSWIDRLSKPAAEQGDADYECRAHACKRIRAELKARNAEQAAALAECFRLAGGDTECDPNPAARAVEVVRDLRECYEERGRELSALLAGIAGLEQKWREAAGRLEETAAGETPITWALLHARAETYRARADDLKAFREGVENG